MISKEGPYLERLKSQRDQLTPAYLEVEMQHQRPLCLVAMQHQHLHYLAGTQHQLLLYSEETLPQLLLCSEETLLLLQPCLEIIMQLPQLKAYSDKAVMLLLHQAYSEMLHQLQDYLEAEAVYLLQVSCLNQITQDYSVNPP